MKESEKISRREFLRLSALGAGVAALAQLPFASYAGFDEEVRLTILHTNDWHSRLEPFPMDGSKFQGQGGAALRAKLIQQIRLEEKNVLLLDAGDIVQGTPYYNLFGGDPEIQLMNEMKYDACTIGNHDFDNGLDGLAGMVSKAQFPFLSANYNFTNTVLAGKILAYKVFVFDRVRIGVFGLGINPDELIGVRQFGDTKYEDAMEKARSTAALLKNQAHCDLVICLSHLGYKYNEKKYSDVHLAGESEDIDLIIGGHTHTFLDFPVSFSNKNDKLVTINQVGWAGLRLGRIDYHFFGRKNNILYKKSPMRI
jgi:5'-nucleotidase